MIAFAQAAGLEVVSTWDLPIPEKKRDLLSMLDDPRAINLDGGPAEI
jgi:hypothetical protein